MRRTIIPRVLAALSGLGILGALSACKPDVQLIPFIKSDGAPYGALTELTPPGHCPQASRVRPHTAP